jgi:hypothetical protein
MTIPLWRSAEKKYLRNTMVDAPTVSKAPGLDMNSASAFPPDILGYFGRHSWPFF